MIIAQNAGMSFGVTGTVKSTGTGIMASVFFVEVSEMREVISVDIPYDPEDNTLLRVSNFHSRRDRFFFTLNCLFLYLS